MKELSVPEGKIVCGFRKEGHLYAESIDMTDDIDELIHFMHILRNSIHYREDPEAYKAKHHIQ